MVLWTSVFQIVQIFIGMLFVLVSLTGIISPTLHIQAPLFLGVSVSFYQLKGGYFDILRQKTLHLQQVADK